MHEALSINNWRAKRAGGRITVYGEESGTGKQLKIVGVDQIVPGPGFCVATDKNGVSHRLSVG